MGKWDGGGQGEPLSSQKTKLKSKLSERLGRKGTNDPRKVANKGRRERLVVAQKGTDDKTGT